MDKKSKNTLIVSIIALALVLIGVTYAYFSARITGLESASTLSLTAGRMGIHYSEGDENISVSNIYPREEAWLTKTFTLTGWNTTDQEMKYLINLDVNTNTFPDNYLTYDFRLLASTDDSDLFEDTGVYINGTGLFSLHKGKFLAADGDTHQYELKIYFKDNGLDQNDAQEAVFNAKINISEYIENKVVNNAMFTKKLFDIDFDKCKQMEIDENGYSEGDATKYCNGEVLTYELYGNTYSYSIYTDVEEGNASWLIENNAIYNFRTIQTNELSIGVEYTQGPFVYKYGFVKDANSVYWDTRLYAYNAVDNWIFLGSFDENQGWGVKLINPDSNVPVLEPVLVSINGKYVTSYNGLFTNYGGSTIDLSGYDTSHVSSMNSIFAGCNAKSLDLSSFDTSNIKDMSFMFADAQATSIDLTNFNTSNVTNMYGMFHHSKFTSLDLSSFDTSNVTDMGWMFYDSQASDINLSSFDSANLEYSDYMFYNSKINVIDLSSFDTSNITYMDYMFSGSEATLGYAKTQADADRLNATSNKPAGLTFTTKS